MPRPAPALDPNGDTAASSARLTRAGDDGSPPGRRLSRLVIAGGVAVLAGAILLAARLLGGDDEPQEPTGTAPSVSVDADRASTWELVGNDPNLSSFHAIAAQTSLVTLLESPGSLTVFAPGNEAIAALPSAAALQSDPNLAAQFVTAHVLVGITYDPASLDQVGTAQVGSQSLPVTSDVVGAATVVDSQRTGNGYLYVIDGVLWSPEATAVTDAVSAAPDAAAITAAPTG